MDRKKNIYIYIVPGTHLIYLTIKPLSSFEPQNSGFVIGKHLIISLFHSLVLHSNKTMSKRFNIYAENKKNKIKVLTPLSTQIVPIEK